MKMIKVTENGESIYLNVKYINSLKLNVDGSRCVVYQALGNGLVKPLFIDQSLEEVMELLK